MTDRVASAEKIVLNVGDAPLRDGGNGKTFVAKVGRVGKTLGLSKIGCTLHVVQPGKRAWPFHRHHVVDELIYVISGAGEYRYGDENLAVRAGDLASAPAGGKAHQLINSGKEELRYLTISSMDEVDIIEYPDSGKVAMAAGIQNNEFKTATYSSVGRVAPADYFDGEEK
jgi:uncharacterized cupin superfamily protein